MSQPHSPTSGLVDDPSLPMNAGAWPSSSRDKAVAVGAASRNHSSTRRTGHGAVGNGAGASKRTTSALSTNGGGGHSRHSSRSSRGWVNRKNVLISGLSVYIGIPFVVIITNTNDDNILFYLMQIVGSVWGMLCVLTIYWSAYMVPRYKRHPNRIMLWRSTCSLGIAVKLLVTEVLLEAECASWQQSRADYSSLLMCKNMRYCEMCSVNEWPAFLLNFFFMAGECWFFCQAMDLYFSLKNPFYSFKGRMVTYHAFVWIFALVDSLVPWVLDLVNKHKRWYDIYGFSEGQGAQIKEPWLVHYHGDHKTNGKCHLMNTTGTSLNATTDDDKQCDYVNEIDMICWFHQAIKDDGDKGIAFNWDQFGRSLIFWIPIVIFSISAVVCLYKAYQRLNDGLSFTFVARLRVFAVNFTQILCYSSWWMIYLFLDLVPYAMGNCSHVAKYFYALRYYMIAARGYIDLLAWFTANDPAKLAKKRKKSKTKGKKAAERDMDRDLQPQVNVALRSEVLHYITSGIRSSIERANPEEFGDNHNPHIPGFNIGGTGGSMVGCGSGNSIGPCTPTRTSQAAGAGLGGGSVFTPVLVDMPTQQLRVARGGGGSSSALDAFGAQSTPAACHSHHPNAGQYGGPGYNDGSGPYAHLPINVIHEDSRPTWPHATSSSSNMDAAMSALDAQSSSSTTFLPGPPADSGEQNPWSAAASRLLFSARGKGGNRQSDERTTHGSLNPAESGGLPDSTFVGWRMERLKVGHLGKIGFVKLLEIAMNDKAINDLTERMRQKARTESQVERGHSNGEDLSRDSEHVGALGDGEQERARDGAQESGQKQNESEEEGKETENEKKEKTVENDRDGGILSNESYDYDSVDGTGKRIHGARSTSAIAVPHEASRSDGTLDEQVAANAPLLPPFGTGASGLGEDYGRGDSSFSGHDSGGSELRAQGSGAESDGEMDKQRHDSDDGVGSHSGSFDDGVYRPEGRSGYRSNSSDQQPWVPLTNEDLEAAMYPDEKKSRLSSFRESLLPQRRTRTGRGGGGRSGSRLSYSSVGSLVVQPQQSPENEVVLLEFEPDSFRRVREHFGITPRSYHAAFKKTAKERLTEGGSSGAFFFYTKCERYMVKSCSEDEFKTLLKLAPDYSEYICLHPKQGQQSFLVRIYGAYTLQLYETNFRFFVMENLFNNDPGDTIQQRFDIKGSSVNRSFTPPRNGQMCTCRHCNQKYIHVKESRTAGSISQRNQNHLGDALETANGSETDGEGVLQGLPSHNMPPSINSLAPPKTGSMVLENLRQWMQNPSYLVKKDAGGSSAAAADGMVHDMRAGLGPGTSFHDDAVGHAEEAMGIPANLLSMTRNLSRDGGGGGGGGGGSGARERERNREAKDMDMDHECPLRLQGRGHEPNIMLKDNDLNVKLRFHPDQAPAVAEQLARDSALLCRHNIMDYSLLLGVMVAEYDIGEEGAAASGGYDTLGGSNISSVGGGAGADGMERLFQSVGDEEGRMGVGSISEEGEGAFSIPGEDGAVATEGATMGASGSPPGRSSHSGPSPPPVGANGLTGMDVTVGSYSSYGSGVGFVGLDGSSPFGLSHEGEDSAGGAGASGAGMSDDGAPRPPELLGAHSHSSSSQLGGSVRAGTGLLRRRSSTSYTAAQSQAINRQSRGSASGSFGSSNNLGALGGRADGRPSNVKLKDDDDPDTPRRGPGNDGAYRAAAAHAAKTPLKRPSQRYTAEEEYGRQVRQNARESHIFQRSVYFLGVIDILQTWDWRKRVERWLKVNVLKQSPTGISAVAPNEYHERFLQKMLDIVLVDETEVA